MATQETVAQPRTFADLFGAISSNIQAVIQGKREVIDLVLLCLVSEGHLLIEDVPGVGKTSLAKALARSVDCSFGRVQFTPDLLPSDVVGVTVWNRNDGKFEFRPGPIFAGIVLGDEINRASPKTQSALLEAMAEGQVTVDGTTHPLPDPFLVVATQNPLSGDLGTFPLVGGQRDRFSVSLSMGLPGRAAELDVLAGRGGDHALEHLAPTADPGTWLRLRREVDDVYLHPVVATYALDLVDSIRAHTGSNQPLSTRAALALVRLARANALADGRAYVAPDDVQAVAVAALAHRIIDVTNDDLVAARAWVTSILTRVPVPPRLDP